MNDDEKRLKRALNRVVKSLMSSTLGEVNLPKGLQKELKKLGFKSASLVYLLFHTQPSIYSAKCAKYGVEFETAIKRLGRRTPRLLKEYMKKVETQLGESLLSSKDDSSIAIDELDIANFDSSDVVYIYKEDEFTADKPVEFRVGQIVALGGKKDVCSGALAAVHFPNSVFQEIDLALHLSNNKLDLQLPGQPSDFAILRAFYVHSPAQTAFKLVSTPPSYFESDPYPAIVQSCNVQPNN
jgi:hypothetical protein